MEKNKEYDSKIITLISRIRILSKEGQKKLLKRLFLGDFFSSYIEERVSNVRQYNDISSEEKEKYKKIITSDVELALDSFLDDMYSDDDKLKNKIIHDFVTNYDYKVKSLKKGVCEKVHSFTPWEIKEGMRPIYSIDGDLDGEAFGKYYERSCKYCGYSQVAYTELEKNLYEEDEKNYKKKLEMKQTKNTEN